MRTITIGFLFSIVTIGGLFFAANAFPETATKVALSACDVDEASWICQTASGEPVLVGTETNRYQCHLGGCCSGNDGIATLDLNSGEVSCRNGGLSPSCACDRLTN